MKVQVTEIQAGDRVWHNGSTELVAQVIYSDLADVYRVIWSDGDSVTVRPTKSFDRVA